MRLLFTHTCKFALFSILPNVKNKKISLSFDRNYFIALEEKAAILLKCSLIDPNELNRPMDIGISLLSSPSFFSQMRVAQNDTVKKHS